MKEATRRCPLITFARAQIDKSRICFEVADVNIDYFMEKNTAAVICAFQMMSDETISFAPFSSVN